VVAARKELVTTARSATVAAQAGTGLVLLTLASGQFQMTLGMRA